MTSAVDLVARLHRVVDQLLEVDRESLDPKALQSLTVAVQAERSRLAVAAADVLHTWEQRAHWQADGSLNAALALGRDTKACRKKSAAELRRARLLQRRLHTRAAVLAGRLSLDHVDLFVQ